MFPGGWCHPLTPTKDDEDSDDNDQIDEILSKLGKLSADDMAFISEARAAKYLKRVNKALGEPDQSVTHASTGLK